MPKSMTIALVSAFPPGTQSLNEYGFHLAKGLSEHPDVKRVVVIADRLSCAEAELDLGPKVQVQRVWSFNSLTAGPSILRALFRARVDGVIWNLQTASFGDREFPAAFGLLAPAAGRLAGIPSGVIAHNLITGIDLDATKLQGQKLRQSIVRAGAAVVNRALVSAHYLTVTLRSYADFLRAKYPDKETHLVPHGTFDTQNIPMVPFEDRPHKIVTMGKFGTYKRLETLLEAFNILRANPDFKDYQLVIGGTNHPNTPGYMEKLAQKYANDPQVSFRGYVPETDIPNFFLDARISVFDYSATTGSSGVLHQTASYGAVPVFPHIGDFVDVCRDEGLAGANYKPNDANDMAAAMTTLLGDPAKAQKIADANRTAALGMPFSKVIDFHVNRIRLLNAPDRGVKTQPAPA